MRVRVRWQIASHGLTRKPVSVFVNDERAWAYRSGSRPTWRTESYLLKFDDEPRPDPDCPHGTIYDCQPFMQNLQEVMLWKKVRGTADARYFVPVLAHAPDFSWIVMPFVEGLRRFHAGNDKVAELEERYGFDSEGQHLRIGSKEPLIYDYGLEASA